MIHLIENYLDIRQVVKLIFENKWINIHMDIEDGNSILEVYLEFLNKNVKKGIKLEVIGYIPILPNFRIYIVANCELKYIIAGTDIKKIQDRRFKDKIKLFKHSTYFLYPKENFIKTINYKTHKEVSANVIETLEGINDETFNTTKNPNEILKYLKVS